MYSLAGNETDVFKIYDETLEPNFGNLNIIGKKPLSPKSPTFFR
jgi:hypothetical protein